MRSERRLRLLALAFVAGGCAHARMADSVVDVQTTAAQELDFWQQVEARPLLTKHDALHGLFLIADGKDERVSWPARLAAARERGWIDDDEARDTDGANEAVTVGYVSVAVCEMLKIPGGVTLRALGPSHRYCTRELVAIGLLPARTSNEPLRGAELVDLAGRIEDWRERQVAAAAAAADAAPDKANADANAKANANDGGAR